MADQRDPWEVYGAPPPSSIAGPPKAFEPGEQERLGLARSADTRDAQRLGLAQENDTQQQDNTRFSRASTLRGDYDQLPTVKSYTTALPKYAAGLASKPDAAGDLNLIYAYASVMDPNSVVRGEEQEAVAGGDTFLNQTTAALKKQLGQGGTFQPEYRKRLREEMANRMGQLNQSFISERVRFKQQADREGINPLDVVGEHPGGRFQDLTRKVLGREPMQLDYNGDPVPHPTAEEPATPAAPQMEGDIGFNVAAKDKATHTPQQEQALASFFAAAPNATPEQIEGFAKSIGLPGVSNAKELSEYYRKGGRGFGGVNELTPEAVKKAAKATVGDTSNGTAAGIVDAVPFAPQIGAAIDTLGLTPGRPSIANSDQSIGDVYAFNRDANNEALTMAQDQAPVSYALGQAGTMIAGGAGIARALPAAGALGAWASRGSLPAQIAKSAPIEAAYGALYGAGRNPNDPLKGALQNGVAAAGGGALGRGAVGALGSAVAPAVGRLGPLYANGVRPTIGQKLGGAANWAEEMLGSVPFVGGVVRSARQESRDQFERGAFNQALGEIGSQLPADIELGTAPHAFMQDAFNEAYDTARRGMQFLPDQQFQSDLAQFSTDIRSGVLDQGEVQQISSIVNTSLGSRLQAAGGRLDGDVYKTASSDIAKAARQLAVRNPNLAERVAEFGHIVDGAARRNSAPEAVNLLDAADRGYSQAVRIEQASSARGGETGRFSPTQFDRAVQKASGGTRSRAYLRGDALMGDYAEAGKTLVDRHPNSGTPERSAALGILAGGLGYVSPATAGVAGLGLAAYAPVVRNGVSRLIAPRQSARLNTLGDILRRNAALGSAAGAPLLLPGEASNAP